jgi:hypothetical protein
MNARNALRIAQDRVRALPPSVAAAVVPAAAANVVRDAIASANDQRTPAGPAVEPDKARPSVAADTDRADSTAGQLTAWAVEVIGLYASCRDQVDGWITFYAGLQSAQPREQSP